MRAVSERRLGEMKIEFSDECAACVIMAAGGYPVSYEKGKEITIPADVYPRVYVAGAAKKDGKLVTNGGRVLGVTNVADTLEEAIKRSYEDVERIKFDGAYYRRDIGAKAIKAKE
ncbi:MAG: phosphoribosylglycinamide synthetase C domain-containing protein [Christensenellales bacterium]